MAINVETAFGVNFKFDPDRMCFTIKGHINHDKQTYQNILSISAESALIHDAIVPINNATERIMKELLRKFAKVVKKES